MYCKARVDKMSWHLPTMHVFTGDYGPFKPRGTNGSGAIEGALVILTATLPKDGASYENDRCCGREESEDGGGAFVVIIIQCTSTQSRPRTSSWGRATVNSMSNSDT